MRMECAKSFEGQLASCCMVILLSSDAILLENTGVFILTSERTDKITCETSLGAKICTT